MSHCVCASGYYRGHVGGSHLIFFVRGAVDTESPLCTMEYDVQQQKIIQLRGYRNHAAPPEVKKFVDRWLEEKCQKQNNRQAA